MPQQTKDTIEKYCERFEKDMLRLFDRHYRKGDPKAMAVSFWLTSRLNEADPPCTTALRTNATRLQRRPVVYPDLRQSARFLHLERASARGGRRTRGRSYVSSERAWQ